METLRDRIQNFYFFLSANFFSQDQQMKHILKENTKRHTMETREMKHIRLQIKTLTGVTRQMEYKCTTVSMP